MPSTVLRIDRHVSRCLNCGNKLTIRKFSKEWFETLVRCTASVGSSSGTQHALTSKHYLVPSDRPRPCACILDWHGFHIESRPIDTPGPRILVVQSKYPTLVDSSMHILTHMAVLFTPNRGGHDGLPDTKRHEPRLQLVPQKQLLRTRRPLSAEPLSGRRRLCCEIRTLVKKLNKQPLQ